MMRSRFGVVLAIGGLVTSLASAVSTVIAQTPTNGGTLVVALPGDIQRTDSSLTDDTNSAYVMNQVMQGLVGLKPGSLSEIIPVLSSGWVVSPDGRTYTFALRKGIKFHDGTDFDANAVKFNYDRWLHIPDSYSKLQYTYFIDVAVKPVVDSVTVTSPTEVAITLKEPNSSFLTTQTLPPFFIASPKALEAGNSSDPDFSKNAYAQGGPMAMTGTGPFKFKEWVPGDHVTLTKNKDYWDQVNAAHLDAIKFETNFPNSTATLNALQSGGIDVAQTLAPIDSKTAASDPSLQAMDRGGSCNLFELAMNQVQKPFNNVKIRQAVAYAINKQALASAFYAGQAVLADNWMPAGLFAYKALNLPTYDPARAKALIAESGVSDLSFDFWYPSNVTRPYMPDPKGEFQAILNDLEAVGFKPNPKTSTWNPDYLTGIGGQYPMYLLGLTCDWAAPDNFLSANLFGYKTLSDGSFGPNPRYNEKNDALQKAMQDALMAPNPDEAARHWRQAQDILAADMPTVPVLSSNPPAVAQKYVKGFVPSASLTELYNSVWIAPH
jgi:peptide/nickel transport system substrate-binding protein